MTGNPGARASSVYGTETGDSVEGAPVRAVRAWLPTTVDRRVLGLAITTLVVQVLIVGTGGAVRLTGSGLGCPTWPRCTEDSFVNTPEMGIHGVIEFGNRLLTFLLVIVAILTFLSVVRMRRERPELFRLSFAIGLLVPIQAVLGGITVLTNLNPWVVGLHFLPSVVMVVLAVVYLWRVVDGPRSGAIAVPQGFRALVALTGVAVVVTVLAGVLTTGSGPHAGDHGAARNGLDSELMQHIHSWPAYAAVAGTVAILAWAIALRLPRVIRFAALLLAVEGVQIAVGLLQARLGLPPLLVGIHMVLAVVLVGATAAVVLSLRPRAAVDHVVDQASERVAV